MCLLVFYMNSDPGPDEFHLILINVRDEIYDRPTSLASFWKKHPNVIGGMDLEPGKEGGTWLAMNKNGKIGALLNILQPTDEILPDKKGRGFLAVNYLIQEQDSLNYLNDISAHGDEYNGFLLVALDLRSLQKPTGTYFTNVCEIPPSQIESGIYAFGNSLNPKDPWPKAIKAKTKFTEVIKSYNKVTEKNTLVEELFQLLQDPVPNEIDENMKNQGKCLTKKFLKKLSAILVQIPESNYGSRCHTVILIDKQGRVDYYERSRKEDSGPSANDPWIANHHSFILNS